MKRKKLVKEINFRIEKGKSLVIHVNSSWGLDTIILENQKGIIVVTAQGHTKFEFGSGKTHPNTCDFWLGNPNFKNSIMDYLTGRFWGQFNWGELSRYLNNKKLNEAINKEISKLVDEIDRKGSTRLNKIVKKFYKKSSS